MQDITILVKRCRALLIGLTAVVTVLCLASWCTNQEFVIRLWSTVTGFWPLAAVSPLSRLLGFALYLWAAVCIIFKTLIMLVLTMNAPIGHKILMLSISGMEIQSVVIGSIIILLSWIMFEAQLLSDENALIP